MLFVWQIIFLLLLSKTLGIRPTKSPQGPHDQLEKGQQLLKSQRKKKKIIQTETHHEPADSQESSDNAEKRVRRCEEEQPFVIRPRETVAVLPKITIIELPKKKEKPKAPEEKKIPEDIAAPKSIAAYVLEQLDVPLSSPSSSTSKKSYDILELETCGLELHEVQKSRKTPSPTPQPTEITTKLSSMEVDKQKGEKVVEIANHIEEVTEIDMAVQEKAEETQGELVKSLVKEIEALEWWKYVNSNEANVQPMGVFENVTDQTIADVDVHDVLDEERAENEQARGDRHLTYEPQTSILSYGPFEKWGIDAIGPLPRSNSGKLYIIMGVDYMTRWAEATTSARITAKEVAKFVYESICCKFGVPLEILSDRGPGFRGDLVGELMKKLGIERRHSTPYYPQCNGLVEKVNGMICKIITKQVVSKPKDWVKHLSAALWAYRTSFRTSLGYTPYHLVFGKEAILPIEVQLASLKILATKNEGTPSDRLKQRILDLERLEIDREMAVEHYATQAERRRQNFNEGLKDKELKRGMLVLCYDNRFDTRKDKKFMPRWEGPYVIRKKYTNGSYRLQDISGKLHKTRVNGWRLKPYFQRFDAEVVVNLPPETSEEEEEDKASSSQQLCEDKDLLEA
ncbi:hypothetical protein L7F22_054805 [Adiantum nelumboides]|nr:hypothetical protein [Adiantum nelumboides]